MPQEPKRRHSIQRKGKRRASIKLSASQYVSCPNCKALILPHAICPNCGYYKGTLKAKPKNKSTSVTRENA